MLPIFGALLPVCIDERWPQCQLALMAQSQQMAKEPFIMWAKEHFYNSLN